MSLTITHRITFIADRPSVREAVSWCFDECVDGFEIDNIYSDEVWANITLTFTSDRDAVLFKTFWNDR